MKEYIISEKSNDELLDIVNNTLRYKADYIYFVFIEVEKRIINRQINYSIEELLGKYESFLKNISFYSVDDILKHIVKNKESLILKKTIEIKNEIIKGNPGINNKIINYVGFWDRFVANLIDGIVLYPFSFLCAWLITLNNPLKYLSVIISGFLYVGYNIYYTKKYGATLGKQNRGIKIVKNNLEHVTWKEAILRNYVDLVFVTIITIYRLLALINIPEDVIHATSIFKVYNVLNLYMPEIVAFLLIFQSIWIWSELIVLLFNKKKKAIHDFIAGTVVIYDN